MSPASAKRAIPPKVRQMNGPPAIPPKDKKRASTVYMTERAWEAADELAASTDGAYSRNEIIELAVMQLLERVKQEPRGPKK